MPASLPSYSLFVTRTLYYICTNALIPSFLPYYIFLHLLFPIFIRSSSYPPHIPLPIPNSTSLSTQGQPLLSASTTNDPRTTYLPRPFPLYSTLSNIPNEQRLIQWQTCFFCVFSWRASTQSSSLFLSSPPPPIPSLLCPMSISSPPGTTARHPHTKQRIYSTNVVVDTQVPAPLTIWSCQPAPTHLDAHAFQLDPIWTFVILIAVMVPISPHSTSITHLKPSLPALAGTALSYSPSGPSTL